MKEQAITRIETDAKEMTLQGPGGSAIVPIGVYNALVRNDFNGADDSFKMATIQAICAIYGLLPVPPPCIFMKNRQGKEVIYFPSEFWQGVAKRNNLTIKITKEGYDERTQNYEIQGYCKSPDGRITEETGRVYIPKTAIGQDYANGVMKCYTVFKKRAVKGHMGMSVPGIGEDPEGVFDAAMDEDIIDRQGLIKAFHAVANSNKVFTDDSKEKERENRHAFYSRVCGREITDFSQVSDAEVALIHDTLISEIHSGALGAAPKAADEHGEVIEGEYTIPSTDQVVAEIHEATNEDPGPDPFGDEDAAMTQDLKAAMWDATVKKAMSIVGPNGGYIDPAKKGHRIIWAQRASKLAGSEVVLDSLKAWIESGALDDLSSADAVLLSQYIANKIEMAKVEPPRNLTNPTNSI